MTVIPLYEEKELLQQVAAGNEQAFRQLFHTHHQKLGAFVLGWTKSLPIAEEIVQDAFLKVWTQRETLTQIDNFSTWLYVLARNHTFNCLRQVSRERLKQKEWQQWADAGTENDGPLPESAWPLIEEAAARLPPQQQKVYLLKSRQGLKYEEIAAELNISPETARKHFAAALRNISAYVRTHIDVTLFILSTPLILS